MKFIRDEEIQNLNGNEDLLETKKYANTLKKVIIDADTPFTIGLFGEWGSGKSSIVNTAQNDLEKDTNIKIKFIKYDAWKYANDSFRRMFLKTVQSELDIEGTEEFESFYIDKNTTTKINKKVNYSFLIVAIILVCIGLGIAFFLPSDMSAPLKNTIPLLITIIGVSIAVARNFFDSYNVTVQNPKIFAPEQFEDIFDEIVDSALSTTTITEPRKWVKGEFTENKLDKLIIIVDNIDRCDKETAYELLTNIKNFLERDGIIFVVPIDDSALRRHLKEKNNEDSKEADEFLRKFFNITLKIKHFQSRDLFIFTNDLNKKYKLNLQADTVDIIAKEYATNPRRIIQLLNNLISELNIVEQKYTNEFAQENESLIAKLLIIREEWSCVYKQISDKPHILKDVTAIKFSESSKLKEDVTHFLVRTKAISENIDIQVIEKLTSNIDNDLKVPNEVLDYIKNNEYDKVIEYIEDNEQFKELMYYLLKELETEITRETYKVGVFNKFKNIIKINELKEIPVEINKKLHRDTSAENILKVLENLSQDDFDDFYKFVDVNQKQNLNYLEKVVIQNYKKTWKEKEDKDNDKTEAEIWVIGLKNFINCSSNVKGIKELSSVFINYYDYNSKFPLYDKKWINEDKLQYIVDKGLINYLVNKATLSNEDSNFKELLYFSTLNLINIENIEDLFEKSIIQPIDLYDTSNAEEAKEEFLNNVLLIIENSVKLSTEVLKKHKFKSKKITDFLKSITQSHTIKYKHPSYPAGQHSQSVIVDILNTLNEEFQKKLLDLYSEIYRATANYTNVSSDMQTLVDKYKNLEKYFFSSLIKLRDSNKYHLQSFFEYLLKINTIDKDLFNLYEKLFIQDEYKDNEKVEEKLNTLILIYLEEENEVIESFLVTMLQYDATKEVITKIVTSLSPDNIISLPQKIQELTYNYLCENDKLFDIEDNIEFIKKVLAFDNKYKDCVVKIIVSKLQEKSKVESALKILEGFTHPSKKQKSSLYTALRTQEKHKDYATEVKEYISKFSE